MDPRKLWPWLREQFPVNRVVALLTPAAATAAGACAAWLANHAPLVAEQVGGEASITAIFVAAFTSVVAMAYKWLDGWSAYERDERLIGSVEGGEGGYPEDIELSVPEVDQPVDPSDYGDGGVADEPSISELEREAPEQMPRRP